MRSVLIAFLICALAATLEGWAAGGGVKARFTQLRQPPFSPSFAVWIGIGFAYYVMCFFILWRLLNIPMVNSSGRVTLALVLLGGIMLANAGWGVLFFRCRNLRLSFLAFPPYVLLTLALGAVLLGIDRFAALILLPYLLYLSYATWWGYRVWRLNGSAPLVP
jgi:tryptophan-rich sensory protein